MQKSKDFVEEFYHILKNAFLSIPITQEKIAVLFSGGVDSSLITKVAGNLGLNIYGYSLLTSKAKDIEHIRLAAKSLKVGHCYVKVSNAQIEKAILEVIRSLKKAGVNIDLMQVSLATGLFLLLQKIDKDKINVVITGQGSDELFAGYHKYKRVEEDKLKQAIMKEIKRYREIDQVRDQSIADVFKIKLFSPFLDKDVINFALNLPSNYLLQNSNNKIIVRLLAKRLGVPEFIYNRPKKAFQYSSGIQKIIQKQTIFRTLTRFVSAY